MRLTRIATLHVDYRYDERTQDGDLDALLDPGQLQTSTRDHVRWNRISSDVEVRPLKTLALRAGVQYAHRDDPSSPIRTSTSAPTSWVPSPRGPGSPGAGLDLFFRYDNVQIDDPWFIPGNSQTAPTVPSREIAYTFQNRGKAGSLRLRLRDWMQFSYDFTGDSFENASFRGRVQRIANMVSA